MSYQNDSDDPIKSYDEFEGGISNDTDDWFERLFPKILTRTAIFIFVGFFLIAGYYYITYPFSSITYKALEVIFWNTVDTAGRFFGLTWFLTFLATAIYKRREKYLSLFYVTALYAIMFGLCILVYLKYVE